MSQFLFLSIYFFFFTWLIFRSRYLFTEKVLSEMIPTKWQHPSASCFNDFTRGWMPSCLVIGEAAEGGCMLPTGLCDVMFWCTKVLTHLLGALRPYSTVINPTVSAGIYTDSPKEWWGWLVSRQVSQCYVIVWAEVVVVWLLDALKTAALCGNREI